MATNHTELSINAINTPGPRPALSIVIGTIKGKSIAPAKGVTATTKRDMRVNQKSLKPF